MDEYGATDYMVTRTFINAHQIAPLKIVIEAYLLTYRMVIKQSLPL